MDYSIIIKAVAVMAGMGALLGVILAIASRKLAVEINPQVEAVLDVLPGSNCGACGFAGCEGAAEAMADAIVRSVREATSAGGVPALRDLQVSAAAK